MSRTVRRRVALGRRLVLSWRPTGRNLAELVRTLVTSFVALGVTFLLLPGRQSSGPVSVLLLVITVVGVGVVLRPLLAGLAVLTGPVGLLVVGLLAQGVILDVALTLAPDVHVLSYPRIALVVVLAAVIAALVNWLLDAGSADAFLAQLLGRVVRVSHRLEGEAGAGEPGLLVVQLDGVGAGVLRQAVVAGAVPTLARWLRDGSHRAYRWHTGLPATTPAGQAVLLHGDVTAVPSFRWYEKDSGRLLVANRPADAALIERRLSTGRGLLADGGVSVSNLFSGDAPARVLVMSDARLPVRRTRGLASFATSLGFLRTLVVFAGQVIQEIYQARRQKRRDVRPRVHRGGVFALLRGVTTALLHDLNVTIVAEQMARGAPVVFVDFVDYDEVAHHAGPTRPEAMRSLDGLDRVLRFFADVATETNRRYEIVVVSDHGQSQGEPFDQLTGQSLEDFVAGLVAGDEPETAPLDRADRRTLAERQAERFGPANLLLTGAARSTRAGIGTLARRRAHPSGPGRDDVTVSLGHPHRPGRAPSGSSRAGVPDGAGGADHADGGAGPDPDTGTAPVVAAAGSLAHIYLPTVAGRATRAQIEARHPRLLAGLVDCPAVGLVLVREGATDEGGTAGSTQPVVLGAAGWRRLRPADVGPERSRFQADLEAQGRGEDPLLPYGPRAAQDLLDLDARDQVGDVIVLGRHDPDTGEVAAFEPLVGSHGGLGGDQTEAVFVVPTTWPGVEPGFRLARPDDPHRRQLTGLEVHRALVGRLRELGLRPGDAPAPAATGPAPAAGQPVARAGRE